ncbi:MAG: DUF4236 domain-containing protein [Clostridiales bacterium]|nr:DUF4236 domain-containing protein [Clostridiales bacterium]
MGISYRKRVKLMPGVTLNFSKSGMSTTIGGKVASVNIGKKGTYLNTGIPGTGIYCRQKIGGSSSASSTRRSSYSSQSSQYSGQSSSSSQGTSWLWILAVLALGILIGVML